MAATDDKQTRPNFFSRLKRDPVWKEYAGYHVGDIIEHQPVAVPPGATIVGNIIAPQIMVMGLLSGAAIGRDVIVSASGEVWGDVQAVHLNVEAGGKIRGWVSSLAEAEYDELAAGALIPLPENGDSPNGLKPEHKRVLDRDRLSSLHRLQTETAVALAARTELEESFDQRLSEIAGDMANQLALLREELNTTQNQLNKVQQDADSTAETLQTREAQVKRQSEELSNTQDLLSQTTEALEELQLKYAQKEELLASLQAAKAGTDTHLEEALVHVDTLTGRIHNIETALQASLLHSSDQEDALLRWQELAETQEKRADELEGNLAKAKRQVQESNDVINMLRDQRKQLEKEWGDAQMRIDELEKEMQSEAARVEALFAKSDETIQSLLNQQSYFEQKAKQTEQLNQELTDDLTQLKEQLAIKEEEVADARAHYKKLHARWKQTSTQLEAIQKQPTRLLSSEQLEEVTEKLREAEEQAKQYHEQMLWNQAELENTRTELNQARERTEKQAKQLEKLNLLNQEVQTLRETLRRQEAQSAQDKENLKQALRAQDSQLDASEKELARYLLETEQQGKRLANIQATLIERELQLQETKQIVAKQQKFIKQMQEVTKAKIQQLQAQVAQRG